MIYTTLNQLKKSGACKERYKVLCKGLGGLTKYGKDTLVSYLQILEINGISDFFWALKNDNNNSIDIIKTISIELIISFSESVLYIFENKFPDDDRPRRAIEAAKECLKNPSFAARTATYSAARAARAAAARATVAAALEAAHAVAAHATYSATYSAARAARAAGDAADYAAADAAVDAAHATYDVARSAVGAAEREKQINIIISIINKN